MNLKVALLVVLVLFALPANPLPAAESGGKPLYLDPAQSLDKRVQDFLARLTLEQKAQVLNHRGSTVVADGFSLRADQWNQCLNGVKWDRPTTFFPICLAMAATWNTNLVHQIATVLSDEARAIYNGWHLDPNAPGEHKGLIYRAPVINIERNPYWGRNHEAWGEDPFLVGRMAVAYVKGLQGDDARYLRLAATLKHYAVNNVETDRQKLDAKVPERWLREYWLPHFRDAVVEGRAQSLMASYNAINGTPNNINRWLLTDVLKHEWQHEGFVVSDLGGVRSMVRGHAGGKMSYADAVAQSVMAGCDFSDKEYEDNIPAAIREGKLTEARLNDAVTRVLRVRFRLGEFDPFTAVPYSAISPDVICSPKHRALALKTAQEAIVLLQNRDNFLPLDRAKLKRIAVLGPLADQIPLNNYNGKTGQTVTPLQGIKDRAAPGTDIIHVHGCDVTDAGGEKATAGKPSGGDVSAKVDRETGFSDGTSVKFDAKAASDYIEFAVDVPAPGTYEVRLQYKSFPTRGIYQLGIDGTNQGPPADMYASPGEYGEVASFGTKTFESAGMKHFRFTAVGKNAASQSFTGHFDKLLLAGPQAVSFEAEVLKFATGGGNNAPAVPPPAPSGSSIAEAAVAARDADVAIVFVGTTREVEHEGRDRKSLGLSGRQEELVKAVCAANPRTAVVQMSAGPLTAPWLKEHVPAMLQAWWPGEEGGHAIADVLFGEVNPAGRLPHTVYASEAQVPPQDEYDISKGFTYMYVKGAPLFPFGHGLSYTTFEYADLSVSGAPLTVTVTIKNTGKRAGDEVAQLYLVPPQSEDARPRLMLRGFQRVNLQPGESKQVRFVVPDEKLMFWNTEAKCFDVARGQWRALLGGSSADVRHQANFTR